MALPSHHLAQLNIARFREAMDSPANAGFVAELDPINEIADNADGFIWRLQDDSGNATSIQFYDDPLQLVNMSVWRDLESLRAFVYRSAHVEIFKRRLEWADPLPDAHQVLWWIPAGHIPDVAEADERLQQLRREGPSPTAFTFASPQPPPT